MRSEAWRGVGALLTRRAINRSARKFTFLALPLLAVLMLKATPFEMGLLTVAGGAPVPLRRPAPESGRRRPRDHRLLQRRVGGGFRPLSCAIARDRTRTRLHLHLGFLAGSLVPQLVARVIGLGPAIAGGVAVLALADLLVPLAAGPRWVVVPLLTTAQFFLGLGLTVFNVNQLSLRQAIVAARLLGRESATARVVASAPIPLGALAVYAALAPPAGCGDVYEAEPEGDLESDASGEPGTAYAAATATVVAVIRRAVPLEEATARMIAMLPTTDAAGIRSPHGLRRRASDLGDNCDCDQRT